MLTLPDDGVEITVAGGFVADRNNTPGESRWHVFGQPNQPLTLSWKRKVDDRRAGLPLRIRARITSLVGLGEDTSQVRADVRVDVVQGLASTIAVSLPPGLVVDQVNGATVADWQADAGTLRVQFLDPISSEADIVIDGELRAPRDGAIAVPLVRVPAAERETGGVAVEVVGAGEFS